MDTPGDGSGITPISDEVERQRIWRVDGHAMTARLLADPRLSLDRAALTVGVRRARADLQSTFGRLWADDRPRIEQVIADTALSTLDAVAAPGSIVNLKWDFALPVAGRILAVVMGLPEADSDRTRGWFQSHFAGQAADSAASLRGLTRYLSQQIGESRRIGERAGGDGHDLLGRLLATVDPAVPRGRLVADLAWLVLGLGWDLAHAVISTGSLLLLGHPAQRALVDADPALFPSAVDEIFRLFNPTPTVQDGGQVVHPGEPFYATADITVAGTTIRRGDTVHLDLAAANRDPTVFADAESFDITRPRGPRIAWEVPGVAFGSLVFLRPEVEVCLRALFLNDLRPHLAEPRQVELLTQPMRLRAEGVTVGFDRAGT